MVQATDSALYGTTGAGGVAGSGTVFKLNPDGSGFSVLRNLDSTTDGAEPIGPLVIGTDGALYGTTLYGGSNGVGTVFKLNPDGTGFTVLRNLDIPTTGGFPYSGLMQGTDGALYGTAHQGGSNGYGTVFRLNLDGTGFTVLESFDAFATGGAPFAGVIQGANGALYGATNFGGVSDGTIFKLNSDGTDFAVLKNLFGGPDLSDGGGVPYSGLVQGTDGALYGTTYYGGSASGTVFKLNLDGGSFTVLQDLDYSTGDNPTGALAIGADGALYGTAPNGGFGGAGTVFKLNPDGSGFAVLLNLDYGTTGAYPNFGLLKGTDGALYGTASNGGLGGAGTVFKLNPDGSGFAILLNLDYGTTGALPNSGLLQGTDGALYGTTALGGSGGYGTVYRLNPDGTGFTVLQNFDYSTTGGYPSYALVSGPGGALYGTAGEGGSSGYGTVFRLNPDGTDFTVLQNFDYSTTGGSPSGALVPGPDGALYGTAGYGGSGGYGTVFRLNPDGTDFNVLFNFDAPTSGSYPYGGLMFASDGNLYGTTSGGGDANAGTVFRLVFIPDNRPPVARCRNATVVAGASCSAAASIDDGSSDPDAGDTITLSQSPAGPYPLGDTLVTLTVTDNHGAASQCTSTVTVVNPDPVVTLTGPASGSIYPVNTPVNFTGSFTDAGGGIHTGVWSFDELTQAATIAEPTGATPGSASATHSFTTPGVYTVKLTVADACGGSATADQMNGLEVMVVVYDPDGGFVTGGGWINSPAGAFTANPTLTGKANFGFVAKYQKGANVPGGDTEFQFKAGNLNFKSTSYDWLVVAGAKAKYKGSGTINGAGDYAFQLTATDGQVNGGGGVDKFRLKIWNKSGGGVVYDNQLNAPDDADATQAIAGGSIVIHKP